MREGFEAAGGFAGVDHFVSDEGGVFIGGRAAVFLEPAFFIEALGAKFFQELLA